MRKRIVIGAVATIGAIALVVVLLKCEFYTEYSFVSAPTGSRWGYREWCFGLGTHHWRQVSNLERFMRLNHPQSLTRERSYSYQRLGKNIFGKTISDREYYGPNPWADLKMWELNAYLNTLSADEHKQLSDFLATAKWPQAVEKVEEIRKSLKAGENGK